MHIPVPNVIVENKAEHVALPNEIYEHMYFVSGTDFLFFHVIYIYTYIYRYIHIYIQYLSTYVYIMFYYVSCINTCRALFSIPEVDMDAV